MEQNNPFSYSSQEFGRSGETQMWKITFQIYNKKNKKHPNKPLQQLCVKVCCELSMGDQVFDDTPTHLLRVSSSSKKIMDLQMARHGETAETWK